MWQYNELYHHGILGQKWGIRRYQNKDGTLTKAGKERYDKSQQEHGSNTLDIRAKAARDRRIDDYVKRYGKLGFREKVYFFSPEYLELCKMDIKIDDLDSELQKEYTGLNREDVMNKLFEQYDSLVSEYNRLKNEVEYISGKKVINYLLEKRS